MAIDKDEIYRQFTTRTANALISEMEYGAYALFADLDSLRGFVVEDPRSALGPLGRIPGLGTKGIAEIYHWAGVDVPRTGGSIDREKQRQRVREERIAKLRNSISLARERIEHWEAELALLER